MLCVSAYILLLSYVANAEDALDIYNKERSNMLEEEIALTVGGQLKLTAAETRANLKLMTLKYREVDEGFHNPHYFNFSRHYFQYKNQMENSSVYQIIQRMPKGAALHVHTSMMVGPDYILKLTYEEHLYICYADDTIKFLFSYAVPHWPCLSKWELMSEVRNASNDTEHFDENLKKYFTMYTEDVDIIYADINKVWDRFNRVYYTISSLLAYRPVREKFFQEALKKFYEDNIMYVEIRSGLHTLYELNGTSHDRMYLARLYNRISNKFVDDHSDFIGVKLIVTRHRALEIEHIRQSIDLARKLKRELPNLYAGFDLVGQEDLGKPLTEFLPALIEAKNELDYYFHAGETNWFGTSTDENLIDAILLGAKRLGHAYALLKHPTLIEAVKKRDVAIEVNVVSNVVLSLVHDVRNHPLAAFLAMGLPVVLSSDDPGAWSAAPLSHDFYITFVGVASRHTDLRTLKQLAINSLKYSALDSARKVKAFAIFKNKWDKFIRDINALKT